MTLGGGEDDEGWGYGWRRRNRAPDPHIRSDERQRHSDAAFDCVELIWRQRSVR
jgi:hypothetical protein